MSQCDALEIVDDEDGLLSPAMSLTKICMVGSGSADEARLVILLIEEMLLERILSALVWIAESGCV